MLRTWMTSPSFRLSSSSFVASKAYVTLQYSLAEETKIVASIRADPQI